MCCAYLAVLLEVLALLLFRLALFARELLLPLLASLLALLLSLELRVAILLELLARLAIGLFSLTLDLGFTRILLGLLLLLGELLIEPEIRLAIKSPRAVLTDRAPPSPSEFPQASRAFPAHHQAARPPAGPSSRSLCRC